MYWNIWIKFGVCANIQFWRYDNAFYTNVEIFMIKYWNSIGFVHKFGIFATNSFWDLKTPKKDKINELRLTIEILKINVCNIISVVPLKEAQTAITLLFTPRYLDSKLLQDEAEEVECLNRTYMLLRLKLMSRRKIDGLNSECYIGTLYNTYNI